MALSASRAAALTIAGCALVAAAWLPPEPTEPMRIWSRNPAQRVRWELRRARRELALAVETLILLERRDSLATALGETASGVRGVAAPDVPPPWRAWLTDGTEGARRLEPVLAAIFLDTADARREPPDRRRWESRSNSTAIAFGTDAAPLTCVAFHDLRWRSGPVDQRTPTHPDRFPERTALSLCRFFAVYGRPGPHVRAWLLDGGWQFGSTAGITRPGAFVVEHGRADVFPHLLADARYVLAACIAGSADACRRWWLDAEDPVSPRADWIRAVTLTSGAVIHWRANAPLDVPAAFVESWWDDFFGGLLDDLASEAGDERFRAFWTSSAPEDSAFASAFGMDVGAWTYGWLARRYGPLPRQGPQGGDYAAAVVVTGLLVAFAAAAGRRRQVR